MSIKAKHVHRPSAKKVSMNDFTGYINELMGFSHRTSSDAKIAISQMISGLIEMNAKEVYDLVHSSGARTLSVRDVEMQFSKYTGAKGAIQSHSSEKHTEESSVSKKYGLTLPVSRVRHHIKAYANMRIAEGADIAFTAAVEHIIKRFLYLVRNQSKERTLTAVLINGVARQHAEWAGIFHIRASTAIMQEKKPKRASSAKKPAKRT